MGASEGLLFVMNIWAQNLVKSSWVADGEDAIFSFILTKFVRCFGRGVGSYLGKNGA